VQKLGASALRAVAARWPLLSRLLGRIAPAPGMNDLVPEGAPAPANPPRQTPSTPAVDPQVTATLVTQLRDRSSEVAVRAAEALAHHPGETTTAALRSVVENIDGYFSAPVRASAVRSLGALLPVDDSTAITQALGDVEATVSLAAIATLAERDVGASAGALIGLLEDRRGFYLPLTRQAAARALGRLHHYDRHRLQSVLATESDEVVRESLSSMAN
jgi:HEAT repeat protein